MYQEAVELIEQLTAVPAGDERRKQLLALHEGLPEDTDAYRNFFELIPHILRDDELRPHLRGLFDWYRKLDAWALKDAGDKEPAAHIAPMALLTVAIADGIALQKLADPGPGLRAGLRPVAPARARLRRVGRRARRRAGLTARPRSGVRAGSPRPR